MRWTTPGPRQVTSMDMSAGLAEHEVSAGSGILLTVKCLSALGGWRQLLAGALREP